MKAVMLGAWNKHHGVIMFNLSKFVAPSMTPPQEQAIRSFKIAMHIAKNTDDTREEISILYNLVMLTYQNGNEKRGLKFSSTPLNLKSK